LGTFWEHRDILLLSFAAAVLGLALVALVNLRRKNRRAQVEAQHRQIELAHTARLALVGEISASIAREITQPLSAILSNAEVAQLLLDAREPNLPDLREIVADIRHDNLRANRIVSHVHDLLQRRELKLERVKINVLAMRVLDLARPEAARRGIALRAEFADGAPEVMGDPIYLQQVLLNLIVNSLDAMRDGHASARVVEVRTVSSDAHFVRVDVTGCGHAIAHDEVLKLFDPSFRSKHEGVGLGLSVARAIVEAHRGKIWADWTDEEGATFRFTIPAIVSPEAAQSLVANR